MKYLFFDIECANCFGNKGKICEFGYVIVDENFNELEKNLLIINPNNRFQPFVIKNMLAYPKSAYLEAKDYTFFFPKIYDLLMDENTIILGHSLYNDFKYLNDESKRYNLSFINKKFYDVKYIYSDLMNKGGLGVSKICEALGINLPEHAHKSVDDAYATMGILKEICKEKEITIDEAITLSENCLGENIEGHITTAKTEILRIKREQRLKEYLEHIEEDDGWRKNKIKFIELADGLKSQGEKVNSILNGKSVCFSINYEGDHFKEVISLIQVLNAHDCTYKLKASESDYFVSYDKKNEDGTYKECARLKYVNEAISNGANIKIITIDELLNILNTTKEDLINMPFPAASSFLVKRKTRKRKVEKIEDEVKIYSDAYEQPTIGSLINNNISVGF